MPTTKKLAELFRAIGEDDVKRAASIASVICENEERKGHRTAARQLRGALRSITDVQTPRTPDRIHREQNGMGFIATALVRLTPEVGLNEVVLTNSARSELELVISEWRKKDELLKRTLVPRAKLLFHGPPGCGKSLTARSIACELQLPIFLVRFDSIIGAYLGQTAIHLRQLFHFAESTPCVLLLDELDALGKQRGNPLDVGELDRIVIALMQELEHSKPLGLIIATSNLARNLDDALWRRFDLALLFKSPTRAQLASFCRKLASKFHIRLPRETISRASKADSFADAEAIVTAEARRQALAGG